MADKLIGESGERRGRLIGMGVFVVILSAGIFFQTRINRVESELATANTELGVARENLERNIAETKEKAAIWESERSALDEKINESRVGNEKLAAEAKKYIALLQEEVDELKAKLATVPSGNVRVIAASTVNTISKSRPAVTPHPLDRTIKLPGDVELSLVHVTNGTFQMGCDQQAMNYNPDEKLHPVTIAKPFWLGRYEISQKQFNVVMRGAEMSKYCDPYHPADSVTWLAAMEFCRKLTALEKQNGNLPEGYEFRLPTEAEWEFAARGGTLSKNFIYSGSNDLSEVACFGKNTSGPVDSGIYSPNELKINDMSGNLWEWCYDWYGAYPDAMATDPVGPATGDYRVTRGGSWDCMASDCRVANRNAIAPDYQYRGLGFRVALAPVLIIKK